MKKLVIPIVILAALSFNSCQNDFLETDQTESISTADLSLYNNDAGAKSFVTAIYAKTLDWNMYSFSWIGITEIASDEGDKGSSAGDTGTDKDQMDALTYNSSSQSCKEIFEGRYNGINKCNQALEFIPKLDQADATLRARLIGEAKFMRALFYFDLVRTFGGVPILDHVPDPNLQADIDAQLTRKSVAEVYAFIEQDLNDATSVLPTSYSSADLGRATKGAANALHAKVALYQKKWADVITYGEQVTGYTLASDYASNFKLAGEFNSESIFELNGVGSTTAKGIAGYSVSQGARGAGGWGWGFNSPSLTLDNSYEAGDLRKAATIIYPGETLYDNRLVGAGVENPRYNYKAYSSAYTESWESDTNLKILRYAEVLLLLAEANNENGNTAQAITYLNQIRTRAGLANTTATSQSDVRTAIWKERWHELAMEHDRFFDLVRTGQAQAALAADGKTFVVGKNEIFPLPQSFITQAAGKSAQNPGYN